MTLQRCVVTLKQSDYIRQCTVATVAISIDQQWGEGPQYAGVEELQDAPGVWSVVPCGGRDVRSLRGGPQQQTLRLHG